MPAAARECVPDGASYPPNRHLGPGGFGPNDGVLTARKSLAYEEMRFGATGLEPATFGLGIRKLPNATIEASRSYDARIRGLSLSLSLPRELALSSKPPRLPCLAGRDG